MISLVTKKKNLQHSAFMSSFNSASVSLDPNLDSPYFSSSYVIVPLLSVSMFAYIVS